jgi:pyruvate ferredoxin oxidoreductase alpha subunit
MSFGMYATPDYYQEFRYEINAAMVRAKKAFREAGREFKEQFGRDYSGLVEGYRLEDADTAIVAMGSICGTIKDAIDEMRDAGEKVGLLKTLSFRPFPAEDVREALKGVSQIAVLEKNLNIGSRMLGAVGLEIKDAVYKSGTPVFSYVGGLGGRDIRKKDIKQLAEWARQGRNDCFFGLREELL